MRHGRSARSAPVDQHRTVSIERRQTRKGEPRYVARIKSGGRLVASKTFRRKGDAATWEREQYRRLAFGEFVPPARSAIPFAVVATQFLDSRRNQISPHSWRTDRDNLAGVPGWLAARPLSAIGESEILAYLTEQLQTKAPSTVQRAKTTLGAVFAYAVRELMITRNPTRGVRMPSSPARITKDVGTFTAEELVHTLEQQHQLRPQLAVVTEFLSLTGLRWSELRALRVRDFQRHPFPAIRVSRAHSEGYTEKGTKTGQTRLVPLTRRAEHLAESRSIGRSPDVYLFASVTGLQLRSDRFRRIIAWSTTAPPGRTIHDLRHYAASAWLRAGIPVNQVSHWLGHANPNTTLKTYAHVLGEAQELAAIQRLNAIEHERRQGGGRENG